MRLYNIDLNLRVYKLTIVLLNLFFLQSSLIFFINLDTVIGIL
jgi:hypothetical protein